MTSAIDIKGIKFTFFFQIANVDISSFHFKTQTFNAVLIVADREVFPRENQNFQGLLISEKSTHIGENAAVCKWRLPLIETITCLALFSKLDFSIFIRRLFIAIASSHYLLQVELISFRMVKTIGGHILRMMKNNLYCTYTLQHSCTFGA